MLLEFQMPGCLPLSRLCQEIRNPAKIYALESRIRSMKSGIRIAASVSQFDDGTESRHI